MTLMTLRGKLSRLSFQSTCGFRNTFDLKLSGTGGRPLKALFMGYKPPEALATVPYEITGRWKKEGKDTVFLITHFKKLPRTGIALTHIDQALPSPQAA